MSRILIPATIDAAPSASHAMLEAVKKQVGSVPNLFRLVATSPVALEGYLGMSGALSKGTLPAATRERIAIAVAEINGCDYCLSAHSFFGKNLAKLSDDELAANRAGTSLDAKADAAVRFAASVTRHRGHVADTELAAVRAAGYTDVIVVGGGNSAVEEALYLSNIAKTVTVVHRRDSFRSEKILSERLFAKPNVSVIWNHEVAEITGTKMPSSVTGVLLRNVDTGALTEKATDGVFVAIGHAPATELFKDKLKHKPNGYLWTAPDSTATDVEGVFAAGDVTDDTFRQAITAAGMGCMAALEAERYLAGHVPVAIAAE